ncbi:MULTISPECIES: hypothetical protein [unclassified Psychrobacter]|uniref:hypothetical protein n=1 Tax=unclassified Psychrobacter TaxID=196806 RepID=UPI003FB7CE1B
MLASLHHVELGQIMSHQVQVGHTQWFPTLSMLGQKCSTDSARLSLSDFEGRGKLRACCSALCWFSLLC